MTNPNTTLTATLDLLRERIKSAISSMPSSAAARRSPDLEVIVPIHALDVVIDALSTPPADDVREALYRAMYTSEPTPDRIASDLFVNRILSDPNIEVRPYGTVTDTEVEAAARAIYEYRGGEWNWDSLAVSFQESYFSDARAALAAARAVPPTRTATPSPQEDPTA